MRVVNTYRVCSLCKTWNSLLELKNPRAIALRIPFMEILAHINCIVNEDDVVGNIFWHKVEHPGKQHVVAPHPTMQGRITSWRFHNTSINKFKRLFHGTPPSDEVITMKRIRNNHKSCIVCMMKEERIWGSIGWRWIVHQSFRRFRCDSHHLKLKQEIKRRK